MRWFTLFALIAVMIGCSSKKGEGTMTGHHTETAASGHAHETGLPAHRGHLPEESATLFVRTMPAKPVAGQPTTLRLMIHAASGAMLKEFTSVHGAKVHLMVVRDGLDQFAHLHPQIDSTGNISAQYTFPTGGTYRLYADYRPVGSGQAMAMAEVQVAGEAPPAPLLTVNAPGKVSGAGLAAQIDTERLTVAQEGIIRFSLFDQTGRAVNDLEPYLEARGHLVVLSHDGKQYVHAHPIDAPAGGNSVAFHTQFTKPGLYKGWGQFQWQGEVRVVPFVVNIN